MYLTSVVDGATHFCSLECHDTAPPAKTPVPLLVYEFITNNTFHHHIHDEDRVSSIPWESRLRIATETAGALAHMHAAPLHIIHRDIKSVNILLDDEYTVKVAYFGVSRLVSFDQTQLATLVQGTYIDPEYFQSGLLTKKSDVNSFGVVLIELLTGEKLDYILEDRAKREGQANQIKGVAEVERKCWRLKGDKRPIMKEVKEELEGLTDYKQHDSWGGIGHNLLNVDEREPLLIEPSNFYGSSQRVAFDSMMNEVILPQMDGGR
ncbi:hypothetical protein RJ640_000371 [Escallonia rubra]|uniref:Protein kinase domain-containing protein n=1 Tax=Escallonia rubra TaxID=112253 RepID=A0AA88RBB4_9ASTE|nr:hypothetical protein RJ640_000371 [Escallonia rubra]